jgi:hypothetical protein
MRESTRAELEDEIYELTRGAVVQVYLDPWTGRVVRRDEGIRLACNHWGSVDYSRDELRQIRDWLKRHLLIRVTASATDEEAVEQAEARA